MFWTLCIAVNEVLMRLELQLGLESMDPGFSSASTGRRRRTGSDDLLRPGARATRGSKVRSTSLLNHTRIDFLALCRSNFAWFICAGSTGQYCCVSGRAGAGLQCAAAWPDTGNRWVAGVCLDEASSCSVRSGPFYNFLKHVSACSSALQVAQQQGSTRGRPAGCCSWSCWRMRSVGSWLEVPQLPLTLRVALSPFAG